MFSRYRTSKFTQEETTYKCEDCTYGTDKKSNFARHLGRKIRNESQVLSITVGQLNSIIKETVMEDSTTKKSTTKDTKVDDRIQARVRRRAILNVSTTIADVDKENLFTVLENNDYMSSEESEEVSCSDSDDDSGKIQFSARKKQSSKKGGAALRPRAATKGISDREEPSSPPSFAIQPFEEPDSSLIASVIN
ncbi:unnamed protein product [Mytilus edulis]|uniref:Uncharacterized protein n=1 Tax=Mytilus edulis TaxID=6550 RepID=A0A8S3QJY2_MYTED|nr:unnamed protein product [Mytilus edulis]